MLLDISTDRGWAAFLSQRVGGGCAALAVEPDASTVHADFFGLFPFSGRGFEAWEIAAVTLHRHPARTILPAPSALL